MGRRRYLVFGRVNPAPILLAVLLAAGAVLFHLRISPVIRDMAAYEARSIATRAIHDSVALSLQQAEVSYRDLALITRDEQGKVTSVQSDMPKINALAASVANRAVEEMSLLSSQKVSLPLGTLLGVPLFSGRGPLVDFYVVPTGYAQSSVENRFTEAGINQTLHSILLQMELGVMGVLPGCRSTTTVSTQVCLAETVIVGAVPEYFTQIEEGEQDLSGRLADYGAGKSHDVS